MRLPYCRAKPAWRSATAQTARAGRDRQQPEAGAEQNHRARFRVVDRAERADRADRVDRPSALHLEGLAPEIRTLAEAEDHVGDRHVPQVGSGCETWRS